MDICGSTFIHKCPRLSTWTFVDPHSSTWTFVDPQTSTWIHMWIFVDECGFLWIFVVHKYPQKSRFIHNHPHKTRRSRTQNSHHHEQEDHRDRDGGEKWVGQLAKLSGTGGPPSGPGARGSASRHGPCAKPMEPIADPIKMNCFFEGDRIWRKSWCQGRLQATTHGRTRLLQNALLSRRP